MREDEPAQNSHFSFGANWQRYLRYVNEERIMCAQRSLTDFLGLQDFRGMSFLDVGCGSGLFSYAAFRLGAVRVMGIDPDPLSIECCRFFHQKAGNPPHWQIHQASILNPEFISRLAPFDIVYAWGSLQHTGQMWEAIKKTAGLVGGGGYLYIAIYNQVDGWMGSSFWLKFKKVYNTLPPAGRRVIDWMAIPPYFAARTLNARSLVADVRSYESSRGMSWRTDITDWLGGLPYECATVEQVFRFVRENCPGFDLENLKTTNSLANNWYLFRRRRT